MTAADSRLALVIGSSFGGLEGTSNDVRLMTEALERHNFEVKALDDETSSREGILKAWEYLIESIQTSKKSTGSDPAVVVYYTGHGGIVDMGTTLISDHEQTPAVRAHQFLVPIDYECTDDIFNGILDIELAKLLERTTDETKNVTIILDCCHSGRMARNPSHPDARAKRLPPVQYSGLRARLEELRGKGITDESTLEGNVNAVRVMAAASDESAWECLGENGVSGVLTRYLATILTGSELENAKVPWRTTMLRIRALVNAEFPQQNPRIEGPFKRLPFSTDESEAIDHRIYMKENKLTLEAGIFHGVQEGDVYDVVHYDQENGNRKFLCEAEITGDIRPERSTAKFIGNAKPIPASTGRALAFLKERKLYRWPTTYPEKFSIIKDHLLHSKFLKPYSGDEQGASLRISESDGNFQVRDRAGRLVVSIGAQSETPETAAEKVVKHAEEVARKHHLLSLPSGTGSEKLNHNVEIQLALRTTGSQETTPLMTDGTATILAGTFLCISMNNCGDSTVYVNVFAIDGASEISLLTNAVDGRKIGAKDGHEMNGPPRNGLKMNWPASLLEERSVMETLVFILTDKPVDLRHFETAHRGNAARGVSNELSHLEMLASHLANGTGRGPERKTVDGSHKYAVIHIPYSLQRWPNSSIMQVGKEWPPLPTLSEHFIADMAEELSSLIRSLKPDATMLEHMVDAVPELLRAFARRIEYNSDKAAHREIAVSVHKHRFHIQNLIKSGGASEERDNDEEEVRTHSASNGGLLLGRHVQESDPEENLPIDVLPEGFWTVEDEVIEPAVINDYDEYRELIQNSQAYDWLLTAIDRESKLVRGAPDIMEQIKSDVMSFLPVVGKISRSEPYQLHTVEFALQWDPISFSQHQYEEVPSVSLEKVITLTGSDDDAQALTTREYLVQIWPLTGNHIMNLVIDVLRTAVGQRSSCTLPDRTNVEAWLKDDAFIVTTTGIAESIVEVGQQFAWLGAALRSSPFETGIASCRPIVEFNNDASSPITNMAQTMNGFSRIHLSLKFPVSPPSTKPDRQLQGACWHPMFKNPILVLGYPILSRYHSGFGLEMPLNMMGELCGSIRIDSFDGKTFIKGFSTMLIATKQAQDLVVWHYLYNVNKERISYLDHTIGEIGGIDIYSLDKARHVIGWCEDCKVMTGDPLLSSRVRESKLPRPHSGCLLEKVNLSFSQFISGGVSFAVGVKDTPPHLTRNGYIPSLRWISTKYVVLWDEEEKRGWLVNGTSALLHIVQATLHHWAEDDFSDCFLFDNNKLVNVADYRSNSASRILSHRGNQELEIYPGRIERFDEEEIKPRRKVEESSKTAKKKQGYYIFQDLVELRLKALEQIVEYQERLAGKNGIDIKKRLRPHLEGWDFVELATDMDPRPRVATLKRPGYGWVDFIRSIGAITLFGRGFGNIIVPRDRGICPTWETLPKGQYNLAVPTLDILKIIKDFGGEEKGPLKPIQELAWHSPDDLAAAYQCQCQQSYWVPRTLWGGSRKHKSPVQILLPIRCRLFLPIRSPRELKESGAVVFGHHDSWKYSWKEDGREDVEELPSASSQAQSSTRSHYDYPAPPSHYSSDATRSQSANDGSSLLAMRTTPSVLGSTESSVTTQPTPTETLSNAVDDLSSSFRTTSVNDDGTEGSSRSLPVEVTRARKLRHEKRRMNPRD